MQPSRPPARLRTEPDRGVNAAMARRLVLRLTRPGVIRLDLARRIQSRVRAFMPRTDLGERLMARSRRSESSEPPDLLVVAARPVEPTEFPGSASRVSPTEQGGPADTRRPVVRPALRPVAATSRTPVRGQEVGALSGSAIVSTRSTSPGTPRGPSLPDRTTLPPSDPEEESSEGPRRRPDLAPGRSGQPVGADHPISLDDPDPVVGIRGALAGGHGSAPGVNPPFTTIAASPGHPPFDEAEADAPVVGPVFEPPVFQAFRRRRVDDEPLKPDPISEGQLGPPPVSPVTRSVTRGDVGPPLSAYRPIQPDSKPPGGENHATHSDERPKIGSDLSAPGDAADFTHESSLQPPYLIPVDATDPPGEWHGRSPTESGRQGIGLPDTTGRGVAEPAVIRLVLPSTRRRGRIDGGPSSDEVDRRDLIGLPWVLPGTRVVPHGAPALPREEEAADPSNEPLGSGSTPGAEDAAAAARAAPSDHFIIQRRAAAALGVEPAEALPNRPAGSRTLPRRAAKTVEMIVPRVFPGTRVVPHGAPALPREEEAADPSNEPLGSGSTPGAEGAAAVARAAPSDHFIIQRRAAAALGVEPAEALPNRPVGPRTLPRLAAKAVEMIVPRVFPGTRVVPHGAPALPREEEAADPSNEPLGSGSTPGAEGAAAMARAAPGEHFVIQRRAAAALGVEPAEALPNRPVGPRTLPRRAAKTDEMIVPGFPGGPVFPGQAEPETPTPDRQDGSPEPLRMIQGSDSGAPIRKPVVVVPQTASGPRSLPPIILHEPPKPFPSNAGEGATADPPVFDKETPGATQPTARTVAAEPSPSAHDRPSWPSVGGKSSRSGVETDEFAEEVFRRLMRRIAVEGERRGRDPWA
jgi:hypothetical protein